MSSARIAGMLTAFETSSPSSAAATCWATITPARSCASSVDAARCGVTTTLSSSSSGPEYGSAEKTSSAAPATWPERSASSSASSSTSSPRAALTMRTPGFMRANASASTEPRVSGVSGRWRVTKSASARTSSWRLGALDAELAEPLLGDERVVARRRASAGRPRAGDLLPDPAEAEHAEGLVRQLEPAVAGALPAPVLERRVRLRDVAREREQQADRVLGRRDDGRLGRVRDDDPSARRGLDVDVVHAHPGAADHLEPVGPLDQVGGQLRRRADDDRVVVADLLRQVAVRVDVDLVALAQELDAGVGDLLPDEDLRAHTVVRSNTSSARPTATPRSMSAPISASASSIPASAVVMSKMS